jgi:hypothetical protein
MSNLNWQIWAMLANTAIFAYLVVMSNYGSGKNYEEVR